MSVVDRCVCHQVPLTVVKRTLESWGRTCGDRSGGVTKGSDEDALVESLARVLKCTTGCGMCEPYVRLTIRTGRTGYDHREPAVRQAVAECKR